MKERQSFTVKELIDYLQKLPQDYKVTFEYGILDELNIQVDDDENIVDFY